MMRRPSLLLGALALAMLAACSAERSGAPLAPATPVAAKGAPVAIAQAYGLRRSGGVSGGSFSLTIDGSQSSHLAVPQLGLTVDVPAGAIAAGTSLTITGTPVAGSTVAYEFEPHGTQFLKPIRLTQSLAGAALPPHAQLEGAYFPSAGDIDPETGIASVAEFLPATVDGQGSTVSFDVWHFSGYMISVGRK